MGLGVEGAGIATWLSQGISVLLCIWFIKKKMQILIPKGEERKFDNKKISILLNNGVPMGLQFSITTTLWERFMWLHLLPLCASNISLPAYSRTSEWRWLPIAVRTWEPGSWIESVRA